MTNVSPEQRGIAPAAAGEAGFSPRWLLRPGAEVGDVAAISRQVFGRPASESPVMERAEIPFGARCALATRPDLGLMSCFGPAPIWSWPASGHGRTALALLRPADGRLHLEQPGHRVSLRAREAVLLDLGRGARFLMPELGRVDLVEVDAGRLATAALPADLNVMRAIPRTNRGLQVLAHYGALVLRGLFPLESETLRELALDHIHALIGAMLADPGAPPVGGQDRKAARLAALKADIEARLERQDLGVETIASLHGVTARTIQKLFESEGRTFSDYVIDRRLERVWARLVAADHDTPSISAIAFEAGFGDLSYFNRRFRRRYGRSPSEVRANASKAFEVDPA